MSVLCERLALLQIGRKFGMEEVAGVTAHSFFHHFRLELFLNHDAWTTHHTQARERWGKVHTEGPTDRRVLDVLINDQPGVGCTAVLYLPFRLRRTT